MQRGEAETPRLDFLTSLGLLALAIATIVGAWRMDRLEIRDIHPASIPGLVPGFLGVALAVCALLLMLRAVRQGGHRLRESPTGDPMVLLRLGAALLITLFYPLVLIGMMPFSLATGLFVFAFILAFEGPLGEHRTLRWRGVLAALVQAVVVALVVSVVFRELFLVRLP